MTKFRKRPIDVEAYQVPPEGQECSDEMCAWLWKATEEVESVGNGSLFIHTPDGTMEARPGNWIIKGVEGDLYPITAAAFAETYDAVA